MGGIKKKVQQIADPANFLGKRTGGVNWGNAMDPGGSMIKTVTGSDIGRKLADPGKLYSDGKVSFETPAMPKTDSELRLEQREKELKLADMQKLKRMRARGILSTKEDLERYGL